MRMPDEKDDTKLQMSPLIDMVFLLIIFFMTASHMSSSKNMDLDIPTASSGNIPKERPDRWTVNVLADGTVFSGQTPVTLDELLSSDGAVSKLVSGICSSDYDAAQRYAGQLKNLTEKEMRSAEEEEKKSFAARAFLPVAAAALAAILLL